MATINLVRQESSLTDDERLKFFSLLLKFVDGLGELNKKRIRRLFSWLMRIEPGEIAVLEVTEPRSGAFHRFHMKLESTLFESQERIEHFEQFRYWLKVGSGHVIWMCGPKGGVVPVPQSISYAKLDEGKYREFHEDMVKFLRSEHACKYLWPHLSNMQSAEMMEGILQGFKQ